MRDLIPAHIPLHAVDIWSQDEARIGQQGSLCRIWTKRGSRPRKVKQRQFLSTYIYGAACHATGKSCGLILPYAKSDGMEIFLKELRASAADDRYIALIVDNAGWHVAKELKVPDGITLIPLPSYSPELNAIEQIWEWLRNHHLSNQCFDSYEHIVETACEAWNSISIDSELIKSIIHREWINLK